MWVYVIGKRTSVSEEKEPVVSVKLFSPWPLPSPVKLTFCQAQVLTSDLSLVTQEQCLLTSFAALMSLLGEE